MGYSGWSEKAYEHVARARETKPDREIFTSHHGVHADLNPDKVEVRESRDSDAHPDSNAIIVAFDVTGSMGGIPMFFAREKLGGLMKLLTSKGYIEDPQVLFAAIGDAYCDRAPLQVGQFESGLEMDDWLTKIFIEHGGGPGIQESYILAHYWASKHTSIDCFEKRGKKGYLFTMGDEQSHDRVTVDQIRRFLGDTVQADVTMEEALAAAREKYEVFHIVVTEGAAGRRPEVLDYWKRLLGQNALILEHKDAVCELIATTIGVCEGNIDIDDVGTDLVAAGASRAAVDAVKRALVPISAGGGALKRADVTGDLPTTGKRGGSTRL